MLADTLDAVSRQAPELNHPTEVLVVDASDGRLEHVRHAYPEARWINFRPPATATVSIPHQRNEGVRQADGEVIVFTDTGCLPEPGWATALLAPLLDGSERITVGRTTGRGSVDLYDATGATPPPYLPEAPTINMAFARSAFDAVGGFDESFEYGSDVDFSWRLVDAGFRLRSVPEAVVTADWGSPRRQLKRAWSYGRGRARLYRKHRARIRTGWRTDPVPFAYAAFLLALPVTLVFPLYPALLLLPALRNRRTRSVLTVADHIVLGAGFLRELSRL